MKLSRPSTFVPPNGFVGAGQQTQAAQLVSMPQRLVTSSPTRRRRKAAKKRAAAPRRAAARRSSRPARLVKGSAAAKRYMASIRRKRKR